MKKITVFIIIHLFFVNLIDAQLVKYDFNTNPYINASIVDADIIASDISLSTGTIQTGITTGTYFLEEPYIEIDDDWDETDIPSVKYISFIITSSNSNSFNLTNISLDAYALGGGPSALTIEVNTNTENTINMPSSLLQNINETLSGYEDITSATIKIYGWDNGSRTLSGTQTLRIDNIEISGSINYPPKDSTSSITLVPSSVPTTISSIANGIKALEFTVTDSATGDASNTLIDTICFVAGINNQISDWTKYIDSVKLKNSHLSNDILGSITTDSLLFETIGLIDINEGIGNTESFELWLWLNDTLSNIDNKQFGFYTDSTLIKCSAIGSIVNHGKLETGSMQLVVDIDASEISANLSETIIRTNSNFNLTVYATDELGNIDADYNESVELSLQSGTGILSSPNGLSTNFSNGEATFSDLVFNATDTVVFEVLSSNLDSYTSAPIIIAKHIFSDNFEQNNLDNWQNTDDWTTSTTEAINGNYSLKHNLDDTSASSFITAEYENSNFNDGTTVWQFSMQNGNFDPTSTNKFWYYLMASSDSLTQESNYGYVVGVNFYGSNDTLSLWRVDENGYKSLISQTEFDWVADTSAFIEVIREVPGTWQLGYSNSSAYSNTSYTSPAFDSTYNNLQNHGLVFSYSTTRAGLLWADDFNFFQLNTPPLVLSVNAENRNEITIQFSETISESEAIIIGNYAIASETDLLITIDSIKFNTDKPNQVSVFVNQLNTTDYSITIQNLRDADGLVMEKQTVNFSYAVEPEPFDVVITEIMFDPEPVVGLPAYEYIEILNTSPNPFNLSDWLIWIGDKDKTLPDTIIQPNEYAIITSNSGVDEFTAYGKTIGAIGTSDLTLSGKAIQLQYKDGKLIDSVYYAQSWLQDEAKEDGGWSLERIDPMNTCSTDFNWTASKDSSGGTPGKVNSVARSNIDNVNPNLANWELNTLQAINLQFSEIINTSDLNDTSKYNFTNDQILVDSAIQYSNTQVTIYLSQILKPDSLYHLQISGLNDLCSNTLKDTTLAIQYFNIDDFDIVINEILADPTPSIGLPEGDFLELLNASDKTINLKDWSLYIGTTRKTLPDISIKPDSLLIICNSINTSDYSNYGNTIELSLSLTISGTAIVLKDTSNAIIDSVFYNQEWYKNENKEDGGWSLERIDPLNTCSTDFNWTASEDTTGGTPGKINSVYKSNLDLIAPYVINSRIIDTSTISICFNEVIAEQSLIATNAFTIENDEITIDSVKYDTELNECIHLYLNKNLTSGIEYNISCKNINDACGNILTDTLFSLLYYEPQANDIIFNEIMADEKPQVTLPEVKYLELFNRSSYPINLNEWTIQYDEIKKEFPDSTILPGEYLIVCEAGDADKLSRFGKVVDILSSTSLNSEGKLLNLVDNKNTIISAVNYSKSWYQNPDKEDGGWTLERIDTDNLCSGKLNWKASEDRSGGTPGSINSVYASNIDTISPVALLTKTLNSKLLQINFSEEIDTLLLNNSNFEMDGYAISNILFNASDLSILQLELDQALTFGAGYIIQFTNIYDLCGNIFNGQNEFDYNEIEVNDIIITEIMVDPTPSAGLPEYEYIELYNTSEKSLNIEDWHIVVNETNKELPYYQLLPQQYVILCSSTAAEELVEFGDIAEVSSWPSLPNTGGKIQLLDTSSTIINSIIYSDDWYQDKEKSSGGWSLEIIDPTNQCSKDNNWQASNSPFGGTPGNINSVNQPNPDNEKPFIDFVAPINDKQIFIHFSEAIPESSLNQLTNFSIQINESTVVRNIDSIFTDNIFIGLTEKLQQNDEITITVRNIEDYCGNEMIDSTISTQYYIAQPYDIVINEVMANPEPTIGLPNAEYIEVYNKTSEKLHLYNWQIQIGSSVKPMPYAFLEPNSYTIICNDEDYDLLKSYGPVIAVPDLPALPQNGQVSLVNSKSKTICITNYFHDWIQDDFKADGGYSLERIDFNNPIESMSNWQVSQNANGGTPGTENSIYRTNPDETPFHLTKAVALDKKTIIVEFNKGVNYSEQIDNLFTINDISIYSIYLIEPYNNAFAITLENELSEKTLYTLTVNTELTDLSGNQLTRNTDDFMLAEMANASDVIINEVMFNSLDESVEFIELYNNSSIAIDLNQFIIATRNSTGEVKNTTPIVQEIILAGEYRVLSINGTYIKDHYYTENEFAFTNSLIPSLSNSEGTIVLMDTIGTVIDEFSYNEEMHFGLLESTKGISLERISFNLPTQSESNWHSAAETVGWATPGYQNSVFEDELSEIESEIEIEPEAFSPDNDGYNDLLNIHYNFDEPGMVANVKIINKNGYTIRQLINNELLAQSGYFVWDGLTDDQEKAPIGIYIIFIEVFDDQGQVKQYKETCVVATKF